MREIKFRGKRKDNGEWVYGYYVQRSHKDCCIYHYIYTGHYFEDEHQEGTELEVYEVIPETVGEFTSLNKNGKDVYEGDDVDVSMSFEGGTLPHRGIIVYDNVFGAFGTKNDAGVTLLHNHCLHTLKVIGDIHTTPELLEAKE